MKNSDMPAAPCSIKANEQMKNLGMACDIDALGLTKREAFAMAAMQGLLPKLQGHAVSSEDVATCSVELADALLKELDKE